MKEFLSMVAAIVLLFNEIKTAIETKPNNLVTSVAKSRTKQIPEKIKISGINSLDPDKSYTG